MTTRIFTQQDQLDFARLSGDNNPIHMDEMAARRSIFGRPVVHGVHLLLCSLDCWLHEHPGPAAIRTLKMHFVKPIGLNDPVQFALSVEKPGRVRVEAMVNGVTAARLLLEFGEVQPRRAIQIPDCYPSQHPPVDVPAGELAAKRGRLDLSLETESFSRRFPHAAGYISPSLTATLLATTRLVGVDCPGLNSVYAELSLVAEASEDQPVMTYEVVTFAERYGQVCMRVVSPEWSGEVKALLRPLPQNQPAYAACLKAIGNLDFSGQRALVVGGSRGLGEITAKLLCAGGASAKLTYHVGLEDANKVVREIADLGGQADCISFDVLNALAFNLHVSCPGWTPTHLYYFATPHISPSVKGRFSPDLFVKFCDYYVSGFANTVNLFRAFGSKNFFYPSTVYLDETPANMVEYASAKAAGETLCAIYQKAFPGMRFFVPRLPRMATDQTAALPSAQNADALPLMARILGNFQQVVDSQALASGPEFVAGTVSAQTQLDHSTP